MKSPSELAKVIVKSLIRMKECDTSSVKLHACKIMRAATDLTLLECKPYVEYWSEENVRYFGRQWTLDCKRYYGFNKQLRGAEWITLVQDEDVVETWAIDGPHHEGRLQDYLDGNGGGQIIGTYRK